MRFIRSEICETEMKTEAHTTKAEQNKPIAWLKLHTSYLDAPALHRVSPRASKNYFMLYMFAGLMDGAGEVYDKDGIITATIDDIAFRLRSSPEELAADLKQLIDVGLLAKAGNYWRIINYTAEQPNMREVREQNKERKQRQRARKNETETETEKENESKSKRRSHTSITRDYPEDGREDGRASSFQTNNTSAYEVIEYWKSLSGKKASHALSVVIAKAFDQAHKIYLSDSKVKIDMMSTMESALSSEPRSPEKYMLSCVRSQLEQYAQALAPTSDEIASTIRIIADIHGEEAVSITAINDHLTNRGSRVITQEEYHRVIEQERQK